VQVSFKGISLQEFFKQWFYQSGHPQLKYDWKWNESKKELHLSVTQLQDSLFSFPLEIALLDTQKNVVETLTLHVSDKNTTFSRKVKIKPSSIQLDPRTHLLFDIK
jgi:aminopeptidase N